VDLRTAIARVSKFAAPAKDQSVLCGIQLYPAVFRAGQPVEEVETKGGDVVRLPHVPAYVTATNGRVGVRINLDPDVVVPHALVDAVALRNAVAQLPKRSFFTIQKTGPAQVVVRSSKTEASFHVPCTEGTAFPALPPLPLQLRLFSRWRETLRVMEAAGDDDKFPDLKNLHLTPSGVEAGDTDRIARAPVSPPLTRGLLVTRDLFRHWPRGKDLFVALGATERILTLLVDEEVRFCEFSDDTAAYDLGPKLPEEHYGYRCCAPRAALMNAIKFGSTSSPNDVVELLFGRGSLEVAGLHTDGSRTSSDTVIALGSTDPVRVVLRGRKLWDLLSSLEDVEVDIGYTAFNQPVRLESTGGYVAAVWPLIPV
jgi:hypothetical protein